MITLPKPSAGFLGSSEYDTVNKSGKANIYSYDSGCVNAMGFNQSKPALKNIWVRQAIAYTLNKKELTQFTLVSSNFAAPAYSILTPDTLYYDGTLTKYDSGKSTVGKCIFRYYELSRGKVFFDGADLTSLNDEELLPFRRKMQSAFQNPYSSLDPTKTVLEILREPMEIHHLGSRKEQSERVLKLLKLVCMEENDLRKYPFELAKVSVSALLSRGP